MKKAEVKNFAQADEVRSFPQGKLELVTWVVGDEAAIVVDFQGMVDYAKPA